MSTWQQIIQCPIDRQPVHVGPDGVYRCAACGFSAPLVQIGGRTIPDFRAENTPQTVSLTFHLPTRPLDRAQVAREYFRAPQADFPHLSLAELGAKFGTKLDKGIQFYAQQVLRESGPDAPILDLGCGKGGNRRYLESLGFRRVVTVDWWADGADVLADAHRLPFPDHAFRMVISTAVFEHLYNPFLAMHEVSRVLDDRGCFMGGASFWEAWHASSAFHLSPDGWNALLAQNNLTLRDLWIGWGIIPAALSHVLTPGHLRRFGYWAQRMVEGGYRLLRGEEAVRKLQLRASGSYIIYATRP